MGYDTINIGDEIQSVAIKLLLQKVDYYVNRDNMLQVFNDKYEKVQVPVNEKILLFINGWHGLPKIFPPPECFIPIFVSSHFTNMFLAQVVDRNLNYFRMLPEIGCRDEWTYNQLKARQIKSRFDGCLTLTLEPPLIINISLDSRIKSYSNINGPIFYYVDTSKSLMEKEKAKYPDITHVWISHIIHRNEGNTNEFRSRFEIAETLLYLYSKAKRVYTSRLHCYLPCKAMGVEVFFVDASMNDPRINSLVGRDDTFYMTRKVHNRNLIRDIMANPSKYTPEP